MTPRDVALSNVAEAGRWLSAANQALNTIIGFGGKRSEIPKLREFKAQKTHFHVELGPAPRFFDLLLAMLPFVETDPTLKLLLAIRFKYWDIMSALARASDIFVNAEAGGGAEDTGTAPAFVPRERDGTLRITPYYESVGPLVQVHCLVHEAAHFTSENIQDYAYRDRTGEDDQEKYINLPAQYAIQNADSYAYFALQMGKGIDRVLDRDE